MTVDIDKQELAKLLREILANVRSHEEMKQLVSQKIPRTGWLRGVRQLNEKWALKERGATNFDDAVDLLVADSWMQDTYRRQQIEAVLREEILQAHENQIADDAAAAQLLSTLETGPRPFTVFFGLEGLRLMPGPFELGPTTFYSQGAPQLNKWQTQVAPTAQADSTPTGTWVDAPVYAKIAVEAARGSQMEIAEGYLEEAVDYLCCYAAARTGHDRSQLCVEGEAHEGVMHAYAFDEHDKLTALHFQRRGAVIPVDIAPVNEEDMRENWALDAVRAALSTPRWERGRRANDMKHRLTLSLHWAARAQQHSLPILSVVDYCTAMETLLLRRSCQKIRSQLAKRLTYLIDRWCKTRGTDVESLVDHNRKASGVDSIERWAKQMYDQRCDCVHDGRVDMDSTLERQADFYWPFVALAAIATVAENLDDWPTFDKFEKAYNDAH